MGRLQDLIDSDDDKSQHDELRIKNGNHFSNKQKKKQERKKKRKEQLRKKKRHQKSYNKGMQEWNLIKDLITSSLAQPPKQAEIQIQFIDQKVQDIMPAQDQQKFSRVFQYFAESQQQQPQNLSNKQGKDQNNQELNANNDPSQSRNQNQFKAPLSKKKLKKKKQQSLADLKMRVKRPDLVEAWDVTSKNPTFLLQLKSIRNSVPVPKHWSQKRKFLQYKRGLQKHAFELPEFIEATGISKVRTKNDAMQQIKNKPRERIQPKMGRLDIDYQVLHDAFFKHSSKPDLSIHGDIYFEGKQFELKMKKYRPGRMSPQLMIALGLPQRNPPPWLMNMMSYGPPPAYPKLRIPGVNAKVPAWMTGNDLFTDENGNVVYADVHGLDKSVYMHRVTTNEHWGQLDNEADDQQLDDDEDIYDQQQEDYDTGLYDTHQQDNTNLQYGKSGLKDGMMSQSGYSSVTSGFESTNVDLRKSSANIAQQNKQLYQVLQQVETKPTGIYGASKGYKIPTNPDKQQQDKNGSKLVINSQPQNKQNNTNGSNTQQQNFKF